MPSNQIADLENQYSSQYLRENIFDYYPEAKIVPRYLYRNFAAAETVLDLGFGGGLWFWASFLPSLQRLDGFDLHAEALASVNDIFDRQRVPDGFAVAHGHMGHVFTYADLMDLQDKAGEFVFQDYRDDWPENILIHKYDLVTEHGGGFGEMDMNRDIPKVLRKVSSVLAADGSFFFMNFNRDTGKGEMARLLENTGLELRDFETVTHGKTQLGVDRFYYGYAAKA